MDFVVPVRRSQEGAGLENRNETEIEQLETEETQETVVEDQMAANQERVQAHPVQEEYYLVAEDGMLLIFLKDQKTICLYTHLLEKSVQTGYNRTQMVTAYA